MKGKINNSLGSSKNNKKIVNKYVKIPERNERRAPSKIGKVAKGLKKYPIPGNKPPAACKIAASAAIKAMNIIFLVGDHVSMAW